MNLTGMGVVNFLWDYWFLVPWILGTLVAFRLGGWRAALAVLTLGSGYFLYKSGRRAERQNQQKAVQHIKENREKAYEQITSRNTGKRDVIDRLRNGSY